LFMDELKAALAFFVGYATGEGKYLSRALQCGFRGGKAAAVEARFDNDERVAEPGDELVAGGESVGFGFFFVKEGGKEATVPTDVAGEATMFGGVEVIKSMAHDPDSGNTIFDRGLVRDGVDPKGETAEDHQPREGEFANKACRYLFAVFGWVAGACDGDDLLRVQVGSSLVKEEGRGVGKREQAAGVVGVGEEKGAGADLLKMAKLVSADGVIGELEDGVD